MASNLTDTWQGFSILEGCRSPASGVDEGAGDYTADHSSGAAEIAAGNGSVNGPET